MALCSGGCGAGEPALGAIASGGSGGAQDSSGGSAGAVGTGGSPADASADAEDASLLDASGDTECSSGVRWLESGRCPTLYSRRYFLSAWSGTRVLIWAGEHQGLGGNDVPHELYDGARFDPKTGEWTEMAAVPAAILPQQNAWIGTWTPGALFAWGGSPAVFEFHDTTNTWVATDTVGAPTQSARMDSVLSAKGDVVVWSGINAQLQPVGTRLDMVTKAWTRVGSGDRPLSAGKPFGAWTGSQLVVWGGGWLGDAPARGGGIYDPTTGVWSQFPEAPGDLSSGSLQSVGWTGSELIVWGGADGAGTARADGAAYDPATRLWRQLPAGPSARQNAVTAWTGRELIVYGGYSPQPTDATLTRLVWLYDPRANSWHHEEVCGPPASAYGYPPDTAAFWTGAELLVLDGNAMTIGRLTGI